MISYSAAHSNHGPSSRGFRSAPTCHGQTDRRTDEVGVSGVKKQDSSLSLKTIFVFAVGDVSLSLSRSPPPLSLSLDVGDVIMHAGHVS